MMNFTESLSTRMIAAAGLAATATAAFGQCVPTWDYAIGNPGVADGYVQPMFVWEGDLYAGGSFPMIGGVSDTAYIARWDGSAWNSLGTPGIDPGSSNAFTTSFESFDVNGTEALIVGGFYASAGGLANSMSIAAWDGTEWLSMEPDFALFDAIWGMTTGDLGDGERLYVGGAFEGIGSSAGAGVAQWDGTSWAPVGGGGTFVGTVFDVVIFDDGSGPALYAGGRFNTIDGEPILLLARFKDGAWETVQDGLFGTSPVADAGQLAVFDDGSGPALYVGGRSFFAASSSDMADVYKWDGTEWSGVGQDFTGIVSDLFVWDDGSGEALYMATSSSDLGRLARLEGDTWVTVDGGADGGSVFGLAEWNGDLYVGGSFETVNGEAASGIVRRTGCTASDCYADFDGDGELTIFDFLAYQNAFDAGDLVADCDEDGSLTIFDFLCFQNGFDAGCP
ncbi:MAG: GC-type dockerin domain-anchored protein [Phycisphaerales bacterium]